MLLLYVFAGPGGGGGVVVGYCLMNDYTISQAVRQLLH